MMNAGSLDGSKDLGVICKFVVVSDEELDVSKGSVESGVDRVLFGATSSFLRIRSPYVPVEGAVTLAERMEQAVAATPTPIEDMRGYSDDVVADEQVKRVGVEQFGNAANILHVSSDALLHASSLGGCFKVMQHCHRAVHDIDDSA